MFLNMLFSPKQFFNIPHVQNEKLGPHFQGPHINDPDRPLSPPRRPTVWAKQCFRLRLAVNKPFYQSV